MLIDPVQICIHFIRIHDFSGLITEAVSVIKFRQKAADALHCAVLPIDRIRSQIFICPLINKHINTDCFHLRTVFEKWPGRPASQVISIAVSIKSFIPILIQILTDLCRYFILMGHRPFLLPVIRSFIHIKVTNRRTITSTANIRIAIPLTRSSEELRYTVCTFSRVSVESFS